LIDCGQVNSGELEAFDPGGALIDDLFPIRTHGVGGSGRPSPAFWRGARLRPAALIGELRAGGQSVPVLSTLKSASGSRARRAADGHSG